jgi:6-phosphogluconolactonase/glucosamine-6-phosphate isomerase/deaminase
MQLQCCKDETAWVYAADQWVQDHCRKHNVRRLFLPAGETPKPLYSYWEREKPQYLRGLTLVQIDDVITGQTKARFREFFLQELPSFKSQFEFFTDGEKGADLALLGLGMNGHVAFHEPGLSSEFYSGCVELSGVTRAVLQLSEPTWGGTYGLGAFNLCKGVMLLVRGEKKRPILKRVLHQDREVPAAELMRLQNFTVLTDFEVS